jgi:hypothetical protein
MLIPPAMKTVEKWFFTGHVLFCFGASKLKGSCSYIEFFDHYFNNFLNPSNKLGFLMILGAF